MLIAELWKVSSHDSPFPSASAAPVQEAVVERVRSDEVWSLPYFAGTTERLVGLPAVNAEAGFLRGAKLDTDVRAPFSRREAPRDDEFPPPPADNPPPPADDDEPPRARVAVETAKPNLTVVFTNGYFASTRKQLGVSTPAIASIAYGLYRFGIEIQRFQWFQESLVSVPDQLRISLDLVPQGDD
jgi:hypothetical protein